MARRLILYHFALQALCFLVLVSGMTQSSPLADNLTESEVTDTVQTQTASTDVGVTDAPALKSVYNMLTLHGVALLDEQSLKLTLELEEIWNGSHDRMTSSYGSKVMLREIGDLKVLDSKVRVVNHTAIQITRLEISVPCAMDYFYYPFDRHVCAFSLIHEDNTYLQLDVLNTSVRLSSNFFQTGSFHLSHFKVNSTPSLEDTERGVSGIALQLLLFRPGERTFSVVYFPVMALVVVSCHALFLKSTVLAIYIHLISLVAMIIWVGILELVVINISILTMLDHYNLLSLNFVLNNVFVSLMIHLFFQSSKKLSKTKLRKVASEASVVISPVKLELQSVSSNGNIASSVESQEKDPTTDSEDADDPELHIKKMGKFKRFVYFKGCKPAKYQVPVMFTIFNLIYWIWILVVTLLVPEGFKSVGN